MLVDVDWVCEIFMTDVRLLIMVQLKVATKTHIWVGLRHLENPVLSVCIRTATQAQRDHKIIHARNFRVQPQAIMGSSIVE